MPRKYSDDSATLELFDERSSGTQCIALAPGALLLRRFAALNFNDDCNFSDYGTEALIAAIQTIVAAAPFRHMVTPGGQRMSMAITNCGSVGWISERSGYRYAPLDPASDLPWPPLPQVFNVLAQRAAQRAGFANFVPDSCLLNCYAPGARLSLHQDKDERDFSAPIVSVSLGLPAHFLFGGNQRKQPVQRLLLRHGDVVVWGGPARLAYHGVAPVAAAAHANADEHPFLSGRRINLTFRKAL